MDAVRSLIRKHWFLLGLVVVVALAYWTSDFGKWLDHFPFGASKLAIVGLFFLSGVAISLRNLDRQIRNPRLHLMIQGFGFVLAPGLAYVTSFWIADAQVRQGVCLLAALPTTISSCVAFTAAARGNTLGAILNAVGSNLLGIILSPLLVGLMMGRGGVSTGDVAKLMGELALLVFVPFAVGQIAAAHLDRLRAKLGTIYSDLSQLLVLLLAYCAFSKSIFRLTGQFGMMWQVFAYLAVGQLAMLLLATLAARMAGLPREDRAAAVFCSAQKTLAFGVPIAASLNIDVLPLIFYYLFQMLTSSLFLHEWNRRSAARSATTS